ncbi:hypothetical protein BYT27DRAFT_6490375 [Phlegmacium glaucopus]|nr:hypothetical protein BYT27DRAFT_6490375 [Phlegmacium glaucopus]
MSSKGLSKRHPIDKATRSVKEKLTSLFDLSRPPKPSSIGVGSSSDNHAVTTDAAGTSNLPFNTVSAVDVDLAPSTTVVASKETSTVSPPIYAPISASIPAVHSQPSTVRSSAPETPATVSVHVCAHDRRH